MKAGDHPESIVTERVGSGDSDDYPEHIEVLFDEPQGNGRLTVWRPKPSYPQAKVKFR